jgi:putative ABC transport system permease protein
MKNSITFFYFTLLQIYADKTKHLGVFVIAVLLITLVCSFFFISGSLSKDIQTTLEKGPDYIVQRVLSGKVVDTPVRWVDEMIRIDGIEAANQRVYGRYFYEPAEHYFTIVGIDMYDKQIQNKLQKVVKNIDLKKFLSKDHMIIGEGVKKFLDHYHFFKYYNFRPPDKSKQKVFIYDQFDPKTNLVSSDMIIMEITLAKKILGIKKENCTDIVITIPNMDEKETIKNKIRSHNLFDIRLLSKEDILKAYNGFFEYRSSVFMILFMVILVSFILILYQRYTYINSSEKKGVGIFRALGWSIQKIILLKLIENLIIFSAAFFMGVNLGYFYVYILDAPFLKGIFLGISNLSYSVSFTPVVEVSTLLMLFMFFIVPIIAAVIVPVWRISISDPSEAMR